MKTKKVAPQGRPRALTLQEEFEVIELITYGESKVDVAQKYGVSRMVIWRILKHRAPELLQKRRGADAKS